MTDQDQNAKSKLLEIEQSAEKITPELTAKRKFVEPEISQPVDVLEATTFFQGLDSGATN